MRRLIFSWPALAAALIVWPAATALGLYLFFNVTPLIEARVAPVIEDQSIEFDADDRTPGRMCWTWRWNKVRHGTPLIVAWTIVVRGSAVEYQAVTRRERTGEVIRNPQPAALGKGENSFCADIPAAVDKERDLTILGLINYRLPHGLWTMWQSIPPVNVPPLP